MLVHFYCVKEKLPLEFLLFVLRHDAMEKRSMISPVLLLIRLLSPAANCPTREWGSNPVLHTTYVVHKHPLLPLSSISFVTNH